VNVRSLPRRPRGLDTATIARYGALVLVAELVTLRVASRTAVHIPGLDSVAVGFEVLSEIGRLAFYAAVVLVAMLMMSLTVDAVADRQLPVAIVVGGFLLVAAMAALGRISEPIVDAAAMVAVVAVPLTSGRHLSLGRRVAPALFAVAFVLGGVPTAAAKAFPGLGLPVVELFIAAEALAVAAAIALPARSPGRPERRSVIVATLAAGIVFGALVLQPATVETLMLWNLGLAGYFSPAVYAIAAAAIGYTLHRSWVVGDRHTVVAIGLLVAGGLGLHSSLQSAAFLVGIVVLLQPKAAGSASRTPTAASPSNRLYPDLRHSRAQVDG
jgi:hypothetical protein